jgi:hypothetical protein
MYQTKPPMSTCDGGHKPGKAVKIGTIRALARYFFAVRVTSVTWPIFRPGRGGPLP